MEKALKAASEAYSKGHTCSQALFCAYAEEMGIAKNTAYRLMEAFGGGMANMQEMCGALVAAFAVISYHASDGRLDGGDSRAKTYACIQKAADIFKKEYGGLTCKDILKGQPPQPLQCTMKMKDAVLIIERVIRKMLPGMTETKRLEDHDAS
ncbi:hypothetical protein C4J81_04235 [Deltaproteobacteria bacterium Smac51]|nr:hypothetical protein C4J81_04235 [Deltaproteobacteria bacterium Smac51]